MPSGRALKILLAILALSGCDGVQSALEPAGHGAARIADLTWWMLGGSAVIWAAVIALTVYAIRTVASPEHQKIAKWLIIGGGGIFPVIVLAGLLVYGLSMMPPLLARAPEGSLKIHVTGEQYWWRVRYPHPDGSERTIDLANEIRLPVNEPVEFTLDSPDVIHSFWIPSLGGKMDMIPGRVTRLRLDPTRTGRFRGACAEYCGTSHAWMAFAVEVMERRDFDRWLAHQAEPASPPTDPLAKQGADLFLLHGCSACHTIRGTAARGVVGPDLTHVGSRHTLGAGRLGNSAEDFRHWVADTHLLKPMVLMPHFGMLPPDELRALAAYLESLQ